MSGHKNERYTRCSQCLDFHKDTAVRYFVKDGGDVLALCPACYTDAVMSSEREAARQRKLREGPGPQQPGP